MLVVLAWALGLLVAIEAAVQLRSHLLTGESIFNRLGSGPLFVVDESYGLTLLRANQEVRGQRQVLRSNRLGLRSPELPALKEAGEYRVAVVGASSVMGAEAADNDQTLPAFVQQALHAARPQWKVQVINAGIAGHGLRDEQRMLRYVTDKLGVDLVLLYAGVNDFAAHCRRASQRRTQPQHGLPAVELPDWLLSVDLVLKNTTALRPAASGGVRHVDAARVDLAGYRQQLLSLVRTARDAGVTLVLSTHARSYRPEQPLDEQMALSVTARHYNPCFELDDLHRLYQRHNELIREVAAQAGLVVLPVGETVPGGASHFVDATHFNERGRRLVAGLFAEHLLSMPPRALAVAEAP